MAAGATYEPIATTTLGSNQATVTFSSISGTYTDIIAICNIKGGTANEGCELKINNDSAGNYSVTQLRGDGSSALSNRYTSQSSIFLTSSYGAGTNEWAAVIWNVQNYSNTTTYKTVLGRYSRATGEVTAGVGLWRSTSAINRLDITATGNTFATGSTFTLYGIASA